MELYIMRHGQTDMNISGKMQGHIDCPLNDTGRKQAAAAAEVIRRNHLSFDRVITSRLGRTKETAEIALGLPRTEFETDDRIIEIDYGDWDGKTYEEMGPEMHAFLQDPVNIHAPEGIEPLEEVTRRVGEFLTDLAQNACPEDKILAVSHGVAIRAMFGWIRNLKRPGNEIWRMPVDNCAIFCSELKDGTFSDPELLR
ncbi:MAG: histidine phosphatase family protein [Eubacterium sp.]